MSVEQFETWSMYICISGLIIFMFFIIWDLAKKSNAGKIGTLVLFGVLGLALLVFVFKEIAVYFIEH